MNIFVLDRNIDQCARYHCDQHVVKMILESVQILCSALSAKGFDTPYRPTHAKHPCVLWAGASYDNFLWLKRLAAALNREFRYRFQKEVDHKSMEALRKLKGKSFEKNGLTPFAQAMPEQYRVPGDPVAAYRAYYIGEKLAFARWTRRRTPAWVRAAVQDPPQPKTALSEFRHDNTR